MLRLQPRGRNALAELGSRISRATAERRQKKLLKVQEPISKASRKALVGRTLTALIEGPCEETEHLLEARHYGMAPGIDGRLLINDGHAPAGTLVEVEITDGFAADLVGRIVGPREGRGVVLARRARGRRSGIRLSPPAVLVVSDALKTADLPRGSITTIGSYDGIHRGQRLVLNQVVRRAAELGAPSLVLTLIPTR